MAAAIALRIVIGDCRHTVPLKRGDIDSPAPVGKTAKRACLDLLTTGRG